MKWLSVEALLRLETGGYQPKELHRNLSKELASDASPTIEGDKLKTAVKDALKGITIDVQEVDLWVHSDIVREHPMDHGVALLTMNASLRIYVADSFDMESASGDVAEKLKSNGKALCDSLENEVAEHLSSFGVDELSESMQYADVWVNDNYKVESDGCE